MEPINPGNMEDIPFAKSIEVVGDCYPFLTDDGSFPANISSFMCWATMVLRLFTLFFHPFRYFA